LTIIPYIGFISMTLLSYLIRMSSKRIAAILLIHVFLMLVTVYMKRPFILTAFLIGIPMHLYYLDRMNYTFEENNLDIILFLVFYSIIFTILFNLERITNFLLRDLRLYHEKTEQLNQELETKNAELMQLDEMKDQFISNMSHELRTPINGIIGLAESLVEDSERPNAKETNQVLQTIVSCGIRLNDALNDVLDFALIRHGDLSLDLKAVAVGPLVNECVALFMPAATHKKIMIVNEMELEELKNGGWPEVSGDSFRLRQIIRHVLFNAIKFTPQGQITISAEIEKNMLILHFHDTGIGIPKEKLEKVFQSFVQVNASDTRTHGGIGLGLALAKELLELQMGSIRIDSVEQEWTRVTISLPLANE
jgi:signal transduction histidine kinase